MEDTGLNVRTAALISALVGLLLYANTLDCGFCFDDQAVILDNPDIRPNVSWTNIWLDDFWGTPMSSSKSHGSYRPLCVATFRLNYLLHELQPMGYHLVNVLLHSAVCFLYVQLCGAVFGEAWPALIAGLLFAVHPIHTEAVAGVVGRADTMAGIFFLLSLISYRRATKGEGFQWVWWALLYCLCSVLCKEMGIMSIPVCLTYDLFVANENGLSSILKFFFAYSKKTTPTWIRPFLKRAAALFAFLVVFMVLRIRMMSVTPSFAVEDNEALSLDAPYRQLHWAYMTFINSWLLLDPSWICHDWRMGAIPLIKSVADPRNLLTVITLGVVGMLGLYSIIRIEGHSPDGEGSRRSKGGSGRKHQNKKILTLGLSLIVFPFIPASNLFIPVGFVVAERVLYLPSMGFCLLITYGVYCMLKLNENRSCIRQFLKFLGKAGLILLLVAHSAKTVQRNRDWYSKLSLYTSAAKKYPTNAHLVGNMGFQYTLLGDSKFAEELYKYAVEVNPEVWLPFMNYGVLLKKAARLDEAEVMFKRAAVLMIDERTVAREKVARVYVTLSNIIAKNSSRVEEALEFNRKGIEVYPQLPEAHNSRGSVLHQLNRFPEAKASFEEAIKLNPQYANAHFNWGLAVLHMGDRKSAEEGFRKALAIDRNHLQAKSQLASLLQEQQ